MDDCSLTPGEREERGRELDRIAGAALVRRARTAAGIRLQYRRTAEVEASLRELVRRERECCPFLRLDLRSGASLVTVDIAGPPGAAAVIEAIYARSAPGNDR